MKTKIRKCRKCDRPFKPFEVAYRMRWWVHNPFTGQGRPNVHLCKKCMPETKAESDRLRVRTCYACGFTEAAKPPKKKVKVKKGEQPKLPEKWYCGWRCKRSAKAMIARVGLYCEVCGTALLKAGRTDVQYCGSACRQKAYRARVTAARRA